MIDEQCESKKKRKLDYHEIENHLAEKNVKLKTFYDLFLLKQEIQSDLIQGMIMDSIEIIKSNKNISNDLANELIEFIELVEIFKTADKTKFEIFKSKDLSRILLFYSEICYLTTEKRVQSTIYGFLLKSNDESIAIIKEFIILNNKIHSNEKIDWTFIFKLYISLILKTEIKNLNSENEKNMNLFFGNFFDNCNRFFTNFESSSELFHKEMPKNLIFKSIFLKKKEKPKSKIEIEELLAFRYQCYACEHLLEYFMSSFELKSNKLVLFLQDFCANYFTVTLAKMFRIQIEYAKQLKTCQIGISKCTCESKTNDQNLSIIFKNRIICNECILLETLLNPESNNHLKETHSSFKGKGEITISGNLNVFSIILYMRQCPEVQTFTIKSFSENLIDDVFELKVEAPEVQIPKIKCLFGLYKIHLKEMENKVIKQLNTLFLFLLTQHKNSSLFSIFSPKLIGLIHEFPQLAIFSEYFRVITLLQFESNPDVKHFVMEVYQIMATGLREDALFGYSFKGKPIVQYVIDFVFSLLGNEKNSLLKNALDIIDNLIDRKLISYQIPETFLSIESGLSKDPKTMQIIRNLYYSQIVSSQEVKAIKLTVDQFQFLIKNLDPSDSEMVNPIIQILYQLLFGKENKITIHGAHIATIGKVPRSKSVNYPVNDTILCLYKLLFLLDLGKKTEPSSLFWFPKFIDLLHSNNRGIIKEICVFVLSKKRLLIESQISEFLLIIFRNEKLIKNNNFLCEVAVEFGSVLYSLAQQSFQEINGLMVFEELNSEPIIRSAKILTAALNVLNKNEYNLFYKEKVSEVHLFVTENLFAFPFEVFKQLMKLKIKIDLNFQTFNCIEINLRKNANFLSLSISEISRNFKDDSSSQSNRELFLPIVKCIYAIRKMIELLPQKLFHSNFQTLMFELVSKVFEINEPILIKEAFYIVPKFFEYEIIKIGQLYALIDLILEKKFGANLILKLSHKLLTNKSNLEFVGFIWRKYIHVFYEWIQKHVFLEKQKGKDPNYNQCTNSSSWVSHFNVLKALFCIKELASLREIDLIILLNRSFSWVFAPNPNVSTLVICLVKLLIASDSRLISNKGIRYEITKNLILGFRANGDVSSVSDFVNRFSKILYRLKSHGLETLIIETLSNNISEFERAIFDKNGQIITEFDIIFFTVFSICYENIKMHTLNSITDILMRLIQKSETDFIINKRNYEQKIDVGITEFSNFYMLPILLTKYHYYLYFINCLIITQLTDGEGQLTQKPREIAGSKVNVEVYKILKDFVGKKSGFYLETTIKHMQLLANKIDLINNVRLFSVLKKMLSKMQNKSFIENFENDEFNAELLAEKTTNLQKKQATDFSIKRETKTESVKKLPKLKVKTEKKRPVFVEKKQGEVVNDYQPDHTRYQFRTTVKRSKKSVAYHEAN